MSAIDLPALFDKAFVATQRAIRLGYNYICPQMYAGELRWVVVSRAGKHTTTVLDDDPVATAQNALYSLVHGWTVDFTAADVDAFIAGGTMTDNERQWITRNEAANILGITPRGVHYLSLHFPLTTKPSPRERPGRALPLYLLDDVLAALRRYDPPLGWETVEEVARREGLSTGAVSQQCKLGRRDCRKATTRAQQGRARWWIRKA